METQVLKDKFDDDHRYFVIDSLPSNARSYTNFDKALVRDLMLDEVKYLSKYIVSKVELNQLVASYSDVIKIRMKDGSYLSLDNLELVDFHYLLLLSTLLTDDQVKYTINYTCPHCGEKVSTVFGINSIDYDVANTDIGELKIYVKDQEYTFQPPKIKDVIAQENYKQYFELFNKKYNLNIDEGIFKDLMSISIMLSWNTSEDLLNNIKTIIKNPVLVKKISSLSHEFKTSLAPVTVVCPKCGQSTQVTFDFSELWGYLQGRY